MAEKLAKSKSKSSKNNKKKLDISALAVIDNVVYNKSDAWAYYRLTNSVYDFLSDDAKVSVASQLVNAFSNLIADRVDPLECHMIVTSTPVDVDSWEDQIRTVSKNWNHAPGFDRYLQETVEHLKREEYLKKVTYLGINLGKRGSLGLGGSALEGGIQGAFEQVKNWLNTALQLPGEEISEVEEKATRAKEEEFYRTISTGNLVGERVTAEEILLLIKRQFYPSMPSPYLDIDHDYRIGPGDLELELSSAIENRLRWLRFDQIVDGEEMIGYRAVLTITNMPRQVDFPYSMPFMYFLHKVGLSFPSYSRFTLMPNEKMKRELEKKKKEAKDELENIAAGAETADTMTGASAPAETAEAIADMHMLNEMLAVDKNPWVQGTYRIVIETPDEATLKNWCATMKQRFGDIGVQLNWTIGDQSQLFLEQMPGDKIREKAHTQITDLVYFGTSGFNYSSDVGDLVSGSDGQEAMGI